jgi:arylsulfatase A-like enzyme
MSDNGMFLGEHRLGDKRLAYEESLRIPMVMAGPGLVPGGRSGLVLNLDVAPTLLELAGVKVPTGVQGRSLVRLLSGEAQRVRDTFLFEYYGEQLIPVVPSFVGVRSAGQKYVRYLAGSDEELYDLGTDAFELTNLAARPEAAGIKQALRNELDRLLAETGAPLPPR